MLNEQKNISSTEINMMHLSVLRLKVVWLELIIKKENIIQEQKYKLALDVRKHELEIIQQLKDIQSELSFLQNEANQNQDSDTAELILAVLKEFYLVNSKF